ncbi:MAG: alpha-D-ribose 1-methylphosphonate 5-triphosphate diphosphatase [Pseudomonadota bacterium]
MHGKGLGREFLCIEPRAATVIRGVILTASVCLSGGRVLAPHGDLEIADVHIVDGRIVEASGPGAARINCSDYCVLPGIVDLHGDAFELELHPRPGVDIALPIAMGSVDRQLLANGITTAFHGLTVSWEQGARSLGAGRHFMDGLWSMRPRLVADHRVQLRWETYAHGAIDDIAQWLTWDPAPSLAFNDHTTSTLKKVQSGQQESLDKWARRTGMTLREYVAAAQAVGQRAMLVPDKIREVAQLARQAGVVMLSHDERTTVERQEFRGLGADICEFPLAPEVADSAIAFGEHVVMGGPNVIRGGSHMGAMSAEEAVRAGLCTVLASDYYYPSLMHAAEQLVERGAASFGEAWNLISRNPAKATNLDDRGIISLGKRADLVVIDTSGPWRLVYTIVGGTVLRFGR